MPCSADATRDHVSRANTSSSILPQSDKGLRWSCIREDSHYFCSLPPSYGHTSVNFKALNLLKIALATCEPGLTEQPRDLHLPCRPSFLFPSVLCFATSETRQRNHFALCQSRGVRGPPACPYRNQDFSPYSSSPTVLSASMLSKKHRSSCHQSQNALEHAASVGSGQRTSLLAFCWYSRGPLSMQSSLTPTSFFCWRHLHHLLCLQLSA